MYFVAAKASLALALPPGYASAVWPPAGIALAVLWLARPALWPGVWLGAAAANFTVDGSLIGAAAIATGNTLEALAGASLARRALGDRRGPFSQVRHVFYFFALALACAAIGAAVGAGVLYGSAGVDAGSLPLHWVTWWLGDATGMAIFAPLIVAWTQPARFEPAARRALERVLLFAGVAAVTAEVFNGFLFGAAALPATFLLAPFVIWAAIRFGMREVTALCAVIAGIAVAASVTQRGPFGEQSATVSLLLQQAFVSTLVATGLVLVALMHELRRMSETMRRANDEMEQMLHVAAHDLQEPLRTVLNFSDLLWRRHAGRFDADANELLGYVTGAAARARQLIQDLLDLAEAGRRALVLERVSSAAALDDALDTLRGAIEESGAQVSRGALPQVRADRRMLVSVLQNLVGNAVKYRSQEAPRVHVAAVRSDREWVFSVRDNGIGIDPRYHRAVFRMFERLQRSGGPDGTGGGLALCKRMVERHGGRIWLESARAQGATFHFSLPAEERIDGH